MRPADSRSWPRFALALVLAHGAVAAAVASASPAGSRAERLPKQTQRHDVRADACGNAVVEAINPAGGAFLFPDCGGTMAKITYGPNNAPASASFTFTSWRSNPNPSICGYVAFQTVFFPVEYVLVSGNASGTVFFQTTSKSSHIRVRNPNQDVSYSLWAFVSGHIQFEETVGTPSASGRFKFPSPLNKQNLPLGSEFCFEFGEGP